MPKKRAKKGQLFSQPLVFILAMVIAALVLFFGYKAVTGIIDASGATAVRSWTQDFERKIEELSFLDVGSTSTAKLTLPNPIQYVCVTSGAPPTNFPAYISQDDRALISVNNDRNIFFLPANAYESNTFAYIENLQPKGTLDCFQNGLIIKLETISGGNVEVSAQ